MRTGALGSLLGFKSDSVSDTEPIRPRPSSGSHRVPKFSAPETSRPSTEPPFPLTGRVIEPIGLMITPSGMALAVLGKGMPEKSNSVVGSKDR